MMDIACDLAKTSHCMKCGLVKPAKEFYVAETGRSLPWCEECRATVNEAPKTWTESEYVLEKEEALKRQENSSEGCLFDELGDE